MPKRDLEVVYKCKCAVRLVLTRLSLSWSIEGVVCRALAFHGGKAWYLISRSLPCNRSWTRHLKHGNPATNTRDSHRLDATGKRDSASNSVSSASKPPISRLVNISFRSDPRSLMMEAVQTGQHRPKDGRNFEQVQEAWSMAHVPYITPRC